jgi:hypothetical protein
MAGMTNFFVRSRLRASSMIEVTTALIIISVIFSLAISIYLNVQRSGFSSGKIMYAMMLDEVYSVMEETGDTENREFVYDEVSIYQETSMHPSNPSLLIVRIGARNAEGKLLIEKKYLKYVAPKE